MSCANAFNLDQTKTWLFGKELTLYHTIPTFNNLEKEDFWKHCGKRQKCWQPTYSPFSTMFSSLPKTNVNFLVTPTLSSANAFNLDQSKTLLFGKELSDHCIQFYIAPAVQLGHTLFSHAFFLSSGLFGKEVTIYRMIPNFDNHSDEGFWKYWWNKKICTSIVFFLSKNKFKFLSRIISFSTKCFQFWHV